MKDDQLIMTDHLEQIKENPYLQYFLGLEAYTNEAPFDPSMLVYFREKIGVELVNKVNKQMGTNIFILGEFLIDNLSVGDNNFSALWGLPLI